MKAAALRGGIASEPCLKWSVIRNLSLPHLEKWLLSGFCPLGWSKGIFFLASGNVPAEIAQMRVLELISANVVAGTRFRGDLQRD